MRAFYLAVVLSTFAGCSSSSAANGGGAGAGGLPNAPGGPAGSGGMSAPSASGGAAAGNPSNGGAGDGGRGSGGTSAPGTGGVSVTTGGRPSSSGGTSTTGGAAGTPGNGGAGGSSGTAGGGGSAGTATETGVLPKITDPGQKGPFTPTTVSSTGPMNGYSAIYPMELGQNGLKHPIVVWGNGAATSTPVYATLLNHLASHGFAILSYNSTPQGPQMTAAIDWMVAESTRQGSTFAGKLDTTSIAAMGHSAGSLATFQIASDMRLKTTMHLNGGTFDPHTDIKNLKMPAAFICGEPGGDGLLNGDVARPNCDIDFMNATTPVWYGDVKGASHMTVALAAVTDPMMAKGFLAATVGWLRWQLAGDTTMKKLFVGSSCDLCMNASVWTVQQKNLM
jgi:hypothetical protein